MKAVDLRADSDSDPREQPGIHRWIRKADSDRSAGRQDEDF